MSLRPKWLKRIRDLIWRRRIGVDEDRLLQLAGLGIWPFELRQVLLAGRRRRLREGWIWITSLSSSGRLIRFLCRLCPDHVRIVRYEEIE